MPKMLEEVWLNEQIEVIAPGHPFSGLRGTIAEVLRVDNEVVFGVDIPVGYEHNHLTFTLADIAVL